jgi:hypothetical protein
MSIDSRNGKKSDNTRTKKNKIGSFVCKRKNNKNGIDNQKNKNNNSGQSKKGNGMASRVGIVRNVVIV